MSQYPSHLPTDKRKRPWPWIRKYGIKKYRLFNPCYDLKIKALESLEITMTNIFNKGFKK